VLIVLAAVAVAALAKTFFVEPFYIPSVSMEPTLMVDDRVLVSRMAYELHPPHRGDVVVFVAPRSEQPHRRPRRSVAAAVVHDVLEALGVVHPTEVDFIKRVIGLPGDTVEARDGHVYINGHLLIEPYLPRGTYTSTFGPVVVPPGHVFVMGDNRTDSIDSRVFGPIPESSIIGRAFLRIWPPWRIGFL
jgi:signal peptidase I